MQSRSVPPTYPAALASADRPRSRRLGFAVVAVLAALIAACGDDAADSPDGAAGAPSEVTVPVSAVAVDVLDQGAEPRAAVSYHLTAGGKQPIRLATEAKVSQQIDTQSVRDFSSPQISLHIDAQVRSIDSDSGAAIIDLAITDASSPNSALNSELAASSGSGAGVTKLPDGSVTALRLRPTEQSQNAARLAIEQSMHQSVYRTIVFPAEDIGIGAKWTIRQRVVSGIALEQVMTVTLLEREGERVVVDVTVTQAPESATWNLPNDAGTLHIDQYLVAGTGRVEIDLGKPLPVRGEITFGGNHVYSDPNGVTALRQNTDNTVRWEPN